MAADDPARPQRRRTRVAADPEIVADEMQSATKRLREQAWKINATTRTPMIIEEPAVEPAPVASEEPGR